MIPVKICGITNEEDALCAAAHGVAAVGFIFYPPSPRFIDPRKARAVIDALPTQVVRVGVFVNETESMIRRILGDCRLDMIQLHGDETPEFCRRFPPERVIKALDLKHDADLDRVEAFDVAAILVDARKDGLYGGTGQKADWALAKKIQKPLILAGGLTEDNILAGIQTVNPAALDINSGVESRPGKKDAGKIAGMMKMIKQATIGETSPPIFLRRDRP
jgi:phosphoribosylanthranilate isomerase